MKLTDDEIKDSRALYFGVNEGDFASDVWLTGGLAWGYIVVIRALHDTIAALQRQHKFELAEARLEEATRGLYKSKPHLSEHTSEYIIAHEWGFSKDTKEWAQYILELTFARDEAKREMENA